MRAMLPEVLCLHPPAVLAAAVSVRGSVPPSAASPVVPQTVLTTARRPEVSRFGACLKKKPNTHNNPGGGEGGGGV